MSQNDYRVNKIGPYWMLVQSSEDQQPASQMRFATKKECVQHFRKLGYRVNSASFKVS